MLLCRLHRSAWKGKGDCYHIVSGILPYGLAADEVVCLLSTACAPDCIGFSSVAHMCSFWT